MSKSITLKQMQDDYAKFVKLRGWWKKPNPGVVITALMGELGELVDYFSLKEDFKFIDNLSESEKEALSFEFIDVLRYLMNLANNSGIDLTQAYLEKIPKLERKFPVGSDGIKEHDNYRKSGKNKNYND